MLSLSSSATMVYDPRRRERTHYNLVIRNTWPSLHAVAPSFQCSAVDHWTVSVSIVECCSNPEVPVTEMLYWPLGVPGLP